MKHLVLLLLFCGLGSAVAAQRTQASRQAGFDVTIADSTYHMKQYWPAYR